MSIRTGIPPSVLEQEDEEVVLTMLDLLADHTKDGEEDW